MSQRCVSFFEDDSTHSRHGSTQSKSADRRVIRKLDEPACQSPPRTGEVGHLLYFKLLNCGIRDRSINTQNRLFSAILALAVLVRMVTRSPYPACLKRHQLHHREGLCDTIHPLINHRSKSPCLFRAQSVTHSLGDSVNQYIPIEPSRNRSTSFDGFSRYRVRG